MRVARALAPLLGLVLAAACAREAPATTPGEPEAPVPAAQSTAQPTANQPTVSMNPLEVFQDGFVGRGQPLRNGGAVPLGGDVRAEIFIDPYPATGGTSWLDLYLASNGQPIKNAAVVTDSEMLYMRHGALHQDGRTLGDGHYVFPLNYPMVGVWRHRLSISLAQEHYILPLAVTVFPS